MAEIDPYAPCPCGSGQKFKWCCQKVEAYAKKAERLLKNGQFEAALAAFDEGLRAAPDNPWLSLRKAVELHRHGRPAEARPILERVVAKTPAHLAAHAVLVQILFITDGAAAAAAAMQRALECAPIDQSPTLVIATDIFSIMLARAEVIPAAIRFQRLHERYNASEQPDGEFLAEMLANPGIPPWLKEPYELSPAPENAPAPARERFEAALRQADLGRFKGAAEQFEALAAEGIVVADRNAGLCRLWIVDEDRAVADLRRYIAKIGETEEAVDLETLCQMVAPPSPEDMIDLVQLVWPIRDRDLLLKTLRERRDLSEGDLEPIDENDQDSPEAETFNVLDRDFDPDAVIERTDQMCRALAIIRVGEETVILEGLDDGRLDALSERFREIAGASIPPAHPKTKVISSVNRHVEGSRVSWYLPFTEDREVAERLRRLQKEHSLRELWPKMPLPAFKYRSAEQAAKAGDAAVPLRAALFRFDWQFERDKVQSVVGELRHALNVPPEPQIDPNAVEIARLPISRLSLVPVADLDDDRLVELLRRAAQYLQSSALTTSAREVAARPRLFEKGVVARLEIHSILSSLASARNEKQEAYSWVERGRNEEPPADRAKNAARWAMLEIRIRARFERPEVWVPELVAILEAFASSKELNEGIVFGLLEMGLLRAEPHPEREGEILLDSRQLQKLIELYGPRITTAAGTLGVSAAKQGIWTPGGPSNAAPGSTIWSPGSNPAPTESEKPKLFLPS